MRQQAVDLHAKASAIHQAEAVRVKGANDLARADHRRATIDRAVKADAIDQERRRLTREADAAHKAAADLLQDWTVKAAAVAETRARLDGIAVAAPLDLDGAEREAADLGWRVTDLDLTRESVEAANARAREMGALASELATAQAMAEAWSAVEWALQRVRERDLASRGGPLIERMDRFMEAAGRPERAFLRAGKGKLDFGWRRGADEIPIEALSGGETVLACAALAGAIVALRAPAVRVLLVEAAELGLSHAGALMAGLEALDGEVGTALVASCLPAEPREGWAHLEVAAQQAVNAGAAA
jgi:hypothetical protein